MQLLSIETATHQQSVALIRDQQVIACENREIVDSHTRWLIPTIDQLLGAFNLQLTELDGLAVSIGPGSFTGLRVGLATMMGFRMVTGLPLVAVPTLEAMAWNLRHEQRPICPVLKSRVEEVYWALFEWKGKVLIRLSEDRVGSLEEFVSAIKESTVMFGEAWLENREWLKAHLGVKACEGPAKSMQASAEGVGQIGLKLLKEGKTAGVGLAPRYIQRAGAERNLERNTQVFASLTNA